MSGEFEYDVVFSFAGEERAYVERVAGHLHAADASVFYDEFETINLWGKDLYTHLDEIYRQRGRYCVMFISQAYRQKVWTNHERESAQARAFKQHEEYILPARFDDTEIPGVRPTTGYIDLRPLSPEQFGDMILAKLGKSPAPSTKPSTTANFRKPRLSGDNFNPYQAALDFIAKLTEEIAERCRALSSDGVSATVFVAQGLKCVRIVRKGKVRYSLDVEMGRMGDGGSVNFHGGSGDIRSSPGTSNAWGNMVWDRDREEPVLKFYDLSLLGHVPDTDGRHFTTGTFVDAIWDRICDALEGSS